MGEAVGADGLCGRTWRRGGVRWPGRGRGEGKRKSGAAGRAPVRARRRARCANHSGRRTDSDERAAVALWRQTNVEIACRVRSMPPGDQRRSLGGGRRRGSIAVGSGGRRTEHGRRPGSTERWRPGQCSRRRQVSDNDGQPGASSRQLFSITMNPPWDAPRTLAIPYPPPPSPLLPSSPRSPSLLVALHRTRRVPPSHAPATHPRRAGRGPPHQQCHRRRAQGPCIPLPTTSLSRLHLQRERELMRRKRSKDVKGASSSSSRRVFPRVPSCSPLASTTRDRDECFSCTPAYAATRGRVLIPAASATLRAHAPSDLLGTSTTHAPVSFTRRPIFASPYPLLTLLLLRSDAPRPSRVRQVHPPETIPALLLVTNPRERTALMETNRLFQHPQGHPHDPRRTRLGVRPRRLWR